MQFLALKAEEGMEGGTTSQGMQAVSKRWKAKR
jgi:hypothetical protein